MYSSIVAIALLAAPVLAQLSITTPTFTQCKDVRISWSGGKGDYNLIIVKEEDPCGEPLADLGDHTTTELNWKVALPAGDKVQLSLEDSKTGEEAWSGIITVGESDDKSCLSKATVQSTGTGTGGAGGQSNSGSGSGSNSNGQVSVAGAGSTAVVTPTTTINVPASTPTVTSGPSNGGLSGAVGGVGNAGANPLGVGNGALTMRQASTPAMVLGALAVILVASL